MRYHLDNFVPIHEEMLPKDRSGLLLEFARVDDPEYDSTILGTKEVWVYGNDRTPMSPHFHYIERKGKHPFDIEIKIEDLEICKSSSRKGVDKHSVSSWLNLSKEKKMLEQWLNSPNSDDPNRTNYEMLFIAWNQNNRDNKIKPPANSQGVVKLK